MVTISPYLTFSGNCCEAMTFYQHCLGGTLSFQTVGELPMAEQLPVKMKACIVQATLTKPGFLLIGTDMVGEQGLWTGNAVSMMLTCSSEEETRTYFRKLSEGARQTLPLEQTLWGAVFGGLTDMYGTHWLLYYQQNNKQ